MAQRRSGALHGDDASRGNEEFDVADFFPEVVPIEILDRLDLHTIPPRDIPAVVAEYLRQARAKGFSTVRIIHGKGKGTQRAVIRRILAETDFVHDFEDAPPYSGGWGATIARLQVKPAASFDQREAD